jgi:hypothetical protein
MLLKYDERMRSAIRLSLQTLSLSLSLFETEKDTQTQTNKHKQIAHLLILPSVRLRPFRLLVAH